MYNNRQREIVLKADIARSQFKAIRYGIADLFTECSKMGYKVIRYPMGTNSILGFVQKRDDDIIICTNSSVRLSREIFTLAHELGHSILHLDKISEFTDNDITTGNMTEDIKEKEANLFAAYLLMPDELVRKYVQLDLNTTGEELTATDIANMMSEFNVSFEVVLNRLVDTEIISFAKKVKLDDEKNAVRVGRLLNAAGGNADLNKPAACVQIPFEYMENAIYNYNHGVISKEVLEKVLTYYGLTVEDVSDRLLVYEESAPEDEDWDAFLGGIED